MSDENKSGSDLDIFEGLGKKSAGRISAAPPPPPNSASASQIAVAKPPVAEMKKTLMGMPGPQLPPSAPPAPPASSAPVPAPGPTSSAPARVSAPPPLPSSGPASMRTGASPSKPPPPPGRGSLPNLNATSPASPTSTSSPAPASKENGQSAPPPMSTRPSVATIGQGSTSGSVPGAALPAAGPPTTPNGAKLNMDWDDDDEATHVFDKDSKDNEPVAAAAGPESRRPEHASMDDILTKPRPSSIPAAGTPPPAITATLFGQFGALGQARESNGTPSAPPAQRSGPPAAQTQRSAPPPPPPASMRPYNPSTSTAPMPPPPPPGQTTTAPMHMPPMQQPSQPPVNGQASMPPQQPAVNHSQQQQQQQQRSQAPQQHSQPPQQVSQAPMPQMPPVNRAMEATAVVPRAASSGAALWVALLLGIVAAVGVAVFFLMPRTGTLVVNVADTKGGEVSKLEVLVDGKKACDSAPCIVRDVASGVHEVKVTAAGYDAPAARAVTVEARKDSSTDFALTAAKADGGTGIKVAGNPLQTGVHLTVDGKEIGPLPQELHDLTPGTHTVKILGSDRYAPIEKTVDVRQDELTDLGTVALKVLKGKATIQLGTPGAKVYLVSGSNRKEVPQFPIAIDFDPNEHWNLEAKMAGMDEYSQPISFDDGQAEKTIVVTLSPKGSTPAVKAPTLAAPSNPVVASAPKTSKEPAAAPKTPAAPKEPAAAGGESFLNINSRPASTVLLDGRPLGPTPRVKVPVKPGTHTVLFINAEESLKKSVSVSIAAGETKAVSAKLRD